MTDKEEKILTAALSLFEQKGYDGTSTAEIAREAGVAEGTIFRYFKTKRHLLQGLVKMTAQLMVEHVALPPIKKIFEEAEGKEMKEVLREIVRDRIQFADRHFPLLKVVLSEALFDEELRVGLFEVITEKASPFIGVFFEKLLQSGKIRNVPSKVAIRMFVGGVVATILERKLFDRVISEDQLEEEIEQMLQIFLYGVLLKNEGGN